MIQLEPLNLILGLIAMAIVIAGTGASFYYARKIERIHDEAPELVQRLGPASVYIIDNQPAYAEGLRQQLAGASLLIGRQQVQISADRVHIYATAHAFVWWVRRQFVLECFFGVTWSVLRRDERSIVVCDMGAATESPSAQNSNLRTIRSLRKTLGRNAIIIIHTHRIAPQWLDAAHAAGADACLAKQLSTKSDFVDVIQTLAKFRPKPWVTLLPARNTRSLTCSFTKPRNGRLSELE